MQQSTLHACLALHKIPCLTNKQRCLLLNGVSDIENIFQLTANDFQRLGIATEVHGVFLSGVRDQAFSKVVERESQLIQQQGIQLIPINNEHYPALLKEISNPPALLYLKGNKALLNQPQLAMVGSRRASAQGEQNAYQFAREFASAGFVINSGLALGIDAHCHRGALAANGGTIAVLGTGINVVYPKRNRALFKEIETNGAIVSEFPLGTEPRRECFPQRNRIISGMSLGVLVVEATLNSGSLITADFALEQGREVFAIPGSIHNPASKGCHRLLKQGARMVESTADVMEELSAWAGAVDASPQPAQPATVIALSPPESQLIQLMGFDPIPIDLIQKRSKWLLPVLLETLTRLEIKGAVVQLGGNYQVIRKVN